MEPPIEFSSTILVKKIFIADFYDVLERQKIELKCTPILLLTV